MLSQSTKDFCAGWEAGLATITGEDIPSVFNRFQNLYTIYNRIYRQVPQALGAAGEILPKRIEDNKKATEYVAKFVGARSLLSNLSANSNDEDVETLRRILELGIYKIKFNKEGVHIAAKDAQWANDLASIDSKTKTEAILGVIYSVRCNTVHGQKAQEDHQRLLMSAITRILRTVTNQLYSLLDRQ